MDSASWLLCFCFLLVGFVLTSPPPVRTAARFMGCALLVRAALGVMWASTLTPWALAAVALFTSFALYTSPQLRLLAQLGATQVTVRAHGFLRSCRAKTLGLAHPGPVMRRPRPPGGPPFLPGGQPYLPGGPPSLSSSSSS
jgi:hypothetical protein